MSRRWSITLFLVGLPLFLLACVPEGAQLPQSNLLGTLERKSGLITYLGIDGNIYTIDQGGGQMTAITEDANIDEGEDGILRVYDHPTWSPDGERLAFMMLESNAQSGIVAAVQTSDREGGDPVEIFSSSEQLPLYLYWAPDSERVSFLTSRLSGEPLALQVASRLGGEAEIVDTGQPYFWAWSPIGEEILVHAGGSSVQNPGGAKLAFLALGSRVTEIGLDLEPTIFQAPAISPAGEYILFAGIGSNRRSGLNLANPRGRILTTLIETEDPMAFSWSPDGKYVAYASGQATVDGLQGDFFLVDVEDPQNPVTIDTMASNVTAFFWAPESDRIAYFENVEIPISSDPEETETITLLQLSIYEIADDKKLDLASFQPTESFRRILQYFDQYERSSNIWSPDGNYLVVSTLSSQGQSGIFVIPTSGKIEPRFLIDGLLAFWSSE